MGFRLKDSRQRSLQNELLCLDLVSKYHKDDIGPPLSEWPQWARNLLCVSHKTNQQRFTLWLFLWTNGIHPARAAGIVMYHGNVRYGFHYDNAAHNQMRWLVKTALDTPEYFKKYKSWDCLEKTNA